MQDDDGQALNSIPQVFTGEEVELDPADDVVGEVDLEVELRLLKEANPDLYKHFEETDDLETCRDRVYTYLERRERAVFAVGDRHHPLQNAVIRDCIHVLKSIFGPINEDYTGLSALEYLWKLIRREPEDLEYLVTPGFFAEFIHLFRGADGRAGVYRDMNVGKKKVPEFLQLRERAAALKRSEILDDIGHRLFERTGRFPSGLDSEVIERRKGHRVRILERFGGSEEDWWDYRWHLDHVVKEGRILASLIDLTPEQVQAVDIATKNRIPFGVTPYYLSLMDPELAGREDHAVRAQVIPPPDYVAKMAAHKGDRATHFDFMGEHDTSPADLITRRYPRIAILKPFNTCSQICVYCQRNWEIEECMADDALVPEEKLDRAMAWFRDHPVVGEVLITGGDPMVTEDAYIEMMLEKLSALDHIYRIRFGTRTPVVLPMRWTDGLMKVLSRFHEPGRREICIVTHFEHPYEITPEAREAVA
ncbi:MAG: KamA family radical SAM protein, partial [Planctomycetota bacterium]